MGRCGCASGCGCRHQGRNGIVTSGIGNADSPITVELANPLGTAGCNIIMDCVGSHAGPGLTYASGTRVLSVKIAPGGGLAFDINGALRVTGSGPGPGGPGWPTIPDLEARGTNVVIGHMGAGYLIKPENLIRSFQYGQELGLDAMHVPVRFLSDGAPVVYADEMLGRTAGEPWGGGWNAVDTQNQDGHRAKIIPQLSGMDNIYLRNQPPGLTDPLDFNSWNQAKWALRAPAWGWFGFLEQPQFGMTLLADVLREVGGRTPLILELRFPARNPTTGAFIRETPSWRTALFLVRVRQLIQRMGLVDSVVVTSTEVEIPGESTTPIQVLGFFTELGIRVGPWLETMAASDKYPPNPVNDPVKPWPANWTWVFCSTALTKERVRAYRDLVLAAGPPAKKLSTVLFVVNRQSEWADRVDVEGLLGAISGDPLYAYAQIPGYSPQLGNPLYRKTVNTWNYGTIDHGILPPIDTPENVGPLKRGHRQMTEARTYFGPSMAPVVPGKTYYVNQGWKAPVPTATNWSMHFQMAYDQLVEPTPGQGWMAFSFCRDIDTMFADWHNAAGGTPGQQSGYTLVATQAATIFLFGWSAGAVVTMAQASTAAWQTATYKTFRIGINATGIRARLLNNNGTTAQELFSVTTPLAKAYRGPYIQAGRYSAAGSDWYSWVQADQILLGGGSADGPQ